MSTRTASNSTQPLAPSRVDVFGVNFDQFDEPSLVAHIIRECERGQGGWVVTPNVDIMRQIAQDSELANLVGRASLVVADGAPVEWAARVARKTFAHRAPGASVFWSLSEAAARADRPVLLLGGRRGAPEAAANALRAAYPGIAVDTHWPEMGFEARPQEMADLYSAVERSAGGIVFCGFGFPKQEKLMAELVAAFPQSWFLGIGGAIDMAAGIVGRAPEWMQRAGIEWTYRLGAEPKRLARRYLVEDIPFAAKLMRWAVSERLSALQDHKAIIGNLPLQTP